MVGSQSTTQRPERLLTNDTARSLDLFQKEHKHTSPPHLAVVVKIRLAVKPVAALKRK